MIFARLRTARSTTRGRVPDLPASQQLPIDFFSLIKPALLLPLLEARER